MVKKARLTFANRILLSILQLCKSPNSGSNRVPIEEEIKPLLLIHRPPLSLQLFQSGFIEKIGLFQPKLWSHQVAREWLGSQLLAQPDTVVERIEELLAQGIVVEVPF